MPLTAKQPGPSEQAGPADVFVASPSPFAPPVVTEVQTPVAAQFAEVASPLPLTARPPLVLVELPLPLIATVCAQASPVGFTAAGSAQVCCAAAWPVKATIERSVAAPTALRKISSFPPPS